MMKFDKDDTTSKYIVEDADKQIIAIGDEVVYYRKYSNKLQKGIVVKINEQSVRIKQKITDSYWHTQFGDKVFIIKKNEKDNI